MTPRIRFTGSKTPRIRATSRRGVKVDPSVVAEALGASRTGVVFDEHGSPSGLDMLREQLAKSLRSDGGRPRLEGTVRRQKLPMADEDWTRLEEIAESLRAQGVTVTPGQVAALLLHEAIADFGRQKVLPQIYRQPPTSSVNASRVMEPRGAGYGKKKR